MVATVFVTTSTGLYVHPTQLCNCVSQDLQTISAPIATKSQYTTTAKQRKKKFTLSLYLLHCFAWLERRRRRFFIHSFIDKWCCCCVVCVLFRATLVFHSSVRLHSHVIVVCTRRRRILLRSCTLSVVRGDRHNANHWDIYYVQFVCVWNRLLCAPSAFFCSQLAGLDLDYFINFCCLLKSPAHC